MYFILVPHIIFAVLSIPLMFGAIANEFIGFVKSKKTLPTLSAVSFVGLVLSGTALIIFYHAPVLGACLSGLFYLSGLGVAYVIYKKLASKPTIN